MHSTKTTGTGAINAQLKAQNEGTHVNAYLWMSAGGAIGDIVVSLITWDGVELELDRQSMLGKSTYQYNDRIITGNGDTIKMSYANTGGAGYNTLIRVH